MKRQNNEIFDALKEFAAAARAQNGQIPQNVDNLPLRLLTSDILEYREQICLWEYEHLNRSNKDSVK